MTDVFENGRLPAASRQPKVFVSFVHDKESTEAARELSLALSAQGINVWYADAIEPGRSLSGQLNDAMTDSDAVLLILTAESTKSTQMSFAVASAVLAHRADPLKAVIPVCVPDYNSIEMPPLLQDVSAVNYKGTQDLNSLIARSVQAAATARRAASSSSRTDQSAERLVTHYDEVVGALEVEALQLELLRQAEHRAVVEMNLARTARLSAILSFVLALAAVAGAVVLSLVGREVTAALLALVPTLGVFGVFLARALDRGNGSKVKHDD